MAIIGIIPARYASTRFPGKPLAEINGKPMIQRVYEQAMKATLLSGVIVATDDERIFKAVKQFGGEARMTSPDHPSGTDRCNEVVRILRGEKRAVDVVVNIQGDVPYIHPDQIDQVAGCFKDPETRIATLVRKITIRGELFNNAVVKVAIDRSWHALYFSRHPIPYLRAADSDKWIDHHTFYRHIGIYGYRSEVLEEITRLRPSALEKAESLEQLRWLENGYRITVKETEYEGHAVDTPDDLSKFTNMS